MRIGIGYDVHKFSESRKLVLGGVEIPHSMGLSGHSDADVLTHAICDAVLGACSHGDIGVHFPPTDSKYKDISSLLLLSEIMDKVDAAGFKIVNIDSVVIAEEPELSSFYPEMRENLASVLEVDTSCVSVKATTSEGLGFAGRGEGIAAMAVALLEEQLP